MKITELTIDRYDDVLALMKRTPGICVREADAKAATEKLGMLPPQQGQVRLVRLEPDTPVNKGQIVAMELKLAKHDPVRMAP